MHNRFSFLRFLAQLPTGTLVASLIFSIIIIAAFILYFGTKRGNTILKHIRGHIFEYSMAIVFVVFPILLALLIKMSGFGFYIVFIFFIIVSMLIESLRGGRGGYRNYMMRGGYGIGREELLDAPYYQGYDPIAMEQTLERDRRRQERENALSMAGIYVKPYNNPMGNHTLQNRNCYFYYKCSNNVCTFSCISRETNKTSGITSFKAIGKRDRNWNDDFFTSILRFFSAGTGVDSLYTLFNDQRNFKITKEYSENKESDFGSDNKGTIEEKNLVDVNIASEDELSKLPGINVVLAKKIVSLRENQGGFSSVDDFIKAMGMKAHYAKKIKNLITVSKIEKKKKTKNGRVLDI